MKKISILLLSMLVFSQLVQADQVALMPLDIAKKAEKILVKQETIKHFCKPCRDKFSTTERINRVEITDGYRDDVYVKINGKSVDLAYVYYFKKGIFSKGKWVNLALDMKLKDIFDVDYQLKDK